MDMSQAWRFKAHFLPYVLDEERVLVLAERQAHHLLRGRLYVRLAPLLDGARSGDQIVEALQAEVLPAKVYYALMTLEEKGYLAPASARLPQAQQAFWEGLGAEADEAAMRLSRTAVAVMPVGDTADEAAALAAALAELAMPRAAVDEAALVVAVVEDYLHPALADLNRRMRAAGKRWMLVKAVGQVLWVGPLFAPEADGCWACLARCLQENRSVEMVAQEAAGELPMTSRGALPTTRALAVNLAATEIAAWAVCGARALLHGALLTVDLAHLKTRWHPLRQRPQCTVCGASDPVPPPAHAGVPLRLQHQPKRFTADGGHRVCPPEETLRRLEPLISPITGIVPELVKVTTLDTASVYTVRQILPLGGAQPEHARLGRWIGAAGKGATDVQAQVSCLAEAVERYTTHYQGDEPRLTARYGDLGERALHPRTLLHFSDRQYATREAWNTAHDGFNWVPMPFDDSRAIEWTPCWSLTQEHPRWLPTAYCYYAYPLPPEHRFCRADSNGCASGNTLEEAVLQGFFELVERDAMALWWYNRVRRPALDLRSFHDGFCDAMLAAYQRHNRTLEVLDLTSDLGIPVAAAISWDASSGKIVLGLGAHLEARLAVTRALSELNQMIPFAEDAPPRTDGDAPHSRQDQAVADWFDQATLENQPYLVPDRRHIRTASDFPRLHSADLLDDIRTCLDIVRRHGMEMLVLDMTRPDVDFPTVRVTVPGLRHFWARFAPGRLYDVPVQLGWLERRHDETALNPIPFFF